MIYAWPFSVSSGHLYVIKENVKVYIVLIIKYVISTMVSGVVIVFQSIFRVLKK